MGQTCYVVDDEQHAIDTLVNYIKSSTQWKLMGSTLSPIAALKEIRKHKPDVTFMDVDMPGLSGLELAELVAEHTLVIFTTAYSNYAVEAFEMNVSDYLLKPVSLQRFLKAIKKAESRLDELKDANEAEIKGDYFFINPGVRGKMIKLNFKEIRYIEGLKNYIVFHTLYDKHVTYLTMSEVEKALPYTHFIRVQKSYIVNRDQIKAVDGHHVTLLNGTNIALGNAYKEAIGAFISQNILKTGRKQ